MIHGRFNFWLPRTKQLIQVPNAVVAEGEAAFLAMIAKDDQTIVAGGGNFYIGLMGATYDNDTTLSTLIGEPGATGGYARQAVARNGTGWPVADTVSGIHRVATLVATFTASGADFDEEIQRAFLCSVVSGASGTLFAVSGALPDPVPIVDGQDFDVQYELYLR